MRTIRLIYISVVGLVSFSACNQAEIPPEESFGEETPYISFSATIQDEGSTRSSVLSEDLFKEFYVTSFFGAHDLDGESTEKLTYFKDSHFEKKGSDTEYKSEIKYVWPATKLEFFAYHPSLQSMQTSMEKENDSENPLNFISHPAIEGKSLAGYKLTGFCVHPDISRHFDFMTAHTTTTYKSKGDAIVNLKFDHNLSQIEIKGGFKDGKPNYNLEVAGIRIANPELEGVFNLCGDSHSLTSANIKGLWELPEQKKETKTEYIYHPGEKFVSIVGTDHVSLMGGGGNALVIPTSREKWDVAGDVTNSRNGGYLAVLVRASYEGKRLYPALALADADQVEMVYFAVNDTGEILARLYKGADGVYYTDEEMKNAYSLSQGAIIKEFGWTAIPIEMNWIAGMKYEYKLNFSSGIGVRDPHDPNHPGETILGGAVTANVTLKDWGDGGHTSITVPGVDRK